MGHSLREYHETRMGLDSRRMQGHKPVACKLLLEYAQEWNPFQGLEGWESGDFVREAERPENRWGLIRKQ
jgi:hypothetical protein